MGAAALLVSLTSLGYVIVVWAARPFVPTPDLWSFCARLALQNFFVTGPLFVVEIAGAALVALLDPALLIIGLPLALLSMLRLTARFGLRHADEPARERS
jgi:hypothetical protein